MLPTTLPRKATGRLGSYAAALTVIIACSSCSTQPAATHKASQPAADYLNTALPIDARVDDLVARMTLEEKISQMENDSPAIERLGIPKYNWWTEGLHGVARAGLATVFPQAIGLAATWDTELMQDVASAIGDEARAKHHAFAARDKRFIYQGLTIWSPNINIFRDPRWGRGQETYGEDPYLTGKMAVPFIQGLQGDDPQYLKTVATVKHFAVHNGPEPERHSFDAKTNEQDLQLTYLPQFEMALKEGKAQSLMCAYNRYNGEPACASPRLLENILRDQWQFPGFVVSDCGAIEDIHKYHKVTETPEQSAALAVKTGTDLNCGKMYRYLQGALAQGLVTEQEIDIALKRLIKARMQLGVFDPDEQVPFAQIPYETVNSEEHKALAVDAARKSMVLLKNDNNTLPLRKNLNNIAVIGPNADQWLMLLGNYNGVPEKTITPLEGIRQKVAPNTRVQYAQGSELADGMPLFEPIPATAFNAPVQVEFFNGSDFAQPAAHSGEANNIDVNWHDKAPFADLDDDNFAVKWQGTVTAPASGEYRFAFRSTCNSKLFVNGKEVLNTSYHFRDEYGDPRHLQSEPMTLEQGKAYDITVTAIETYADAQVQLAWAPPRTNLQEAALKVASEADAIVLVMGLTPQLEGEEMKVAVKGFRGGDRTDIRLPEPQEQLIKAVAKLNKPTVLVALNGSALALNWASEHIPAIIEGWYPGQAAGTALADVIFGDYNPAGRLPVTFYRSVNDLPPFEDYALTQQTYRYFEGKPLYPFGYGLSYSNFVYQTLSAPSTVSNEASIPVAVTVANTSKRDGEEVVQLYISRDNRIDGNPIRQLVGFKRVLIKAGSTQTISFTLPRSVFEYVDSEGNKRLRSDRFTLSAGGGQPGQAVNSGKVLSKAVQLSLPQG